MSNSDRSTRYQSRRNSGGRGNQQQQPPNPFASDDEQQPPPQVHTPPHHHRDTRFSVFPGSTPVLAYASEFARTTDEARNQLRDTQLRWTMVKADVSHMRRRCIDMPNNPQDYRNIYPSRSLETITRLTNQRSQCYDQLSTAVATFDATMNEITERFETMTRDANDERHQILETEYNDSARGQGARGGSPRAGGGYPPQPPAL